MTRISEKQFGELQREFDACAGASASFNVYHDDHDYLVLRLKPSSDESEQFGIRFFYCTYIAGPTKWSRAKLSVVREDVGADGSIFVVQDREVGFVVKCHGPIDFAGDPKRVYSMS